MALFEKSGLFHLKGKLSVFAFAVGLDDDVAFSFAEVVERAFHGLTRLQREPFFLGAVSVIINRDAARLQLSGIPDDAVLVLHLHNIFLGSSRESIDLFHPHSTHEK